MVHKSLLTIGAKSVQQLQLKPSLKPKSDTFPVVFLLVASKAVIIGYAFNAYAEEISKRGFCFKNSTTKNSHVTVTTTCGKKLARCYAMIKKLLFYFVYQRPKMFCNWISGKKYNFMVCQK